MAGKPQSREWWYERGQMTGRWQQQKKLERQFDRLTRCVTLALIAFTVMIVAAGVGVLIGLLQG